MSYNLNTKLKLKPKKFSNQKPQQILKHLENLLEPSLRYNLKVDPLGVKFLITETTRRRRKKDSRKRKGIKAEQSAMSKRQRKLSNTKKRTRPKIRSVKKGRTVPLKGRY